MEPIFRKIKKMDVYEFASWGKHEDPRFFQYNFPFELESEFEYWYHMKQKWIAKKVYGLFLDKTPVAFVTLKNIHWLRKNAELGIAVDPNYLNMGYGTLVLNKYLTYIFGTFPIETMYLRVAVFNERAQATYEKVGFKEVMRKFEPFEEQGYKDIIMREFPESFHLIHGELYTEFIIMRILKEDFLNAKL